MMEFCMMIGILDLNELRERGKGEVKTGIICICGISFNVLFIN